MASYLDILRERGFVEQVSDEAGVTALLASPTAAYIGFDPTASSLHVGSLVPIMALAHLQRAGHRPVAIVGGGTALIGDPSGKTELRKMLTPEDIAANAEGIKAQLSRFIEFGPGKAELRNNADWLCAFNYIDFLRDVGRHFSVNRMIAAESYKQRLETGLSFIEFNYQILQAYDFLKLYEDLGCRLQMGGNDQWGNIVAGIDLIRRVRSAEAYAVTFPLITTASGAKMGKTAAGAVWLDKDRVSPYEYYQFWRNTEDADVRRFLGLFTFLPMAEVERLGKLSGEELNESKKVLAFEATKLAHGEDAAKQASDWKTNMPELTVETARLAAGIPVVDVFVESGTCASKSDARRTVEQGGAYVNGTAVTDVAAKLTPADVRDGAIECRAGKKKFFRVVLK